MYTHFKDVIYLLCVYIFWAVVYIYRGAKKENTHVKDVIYLLCV